MAAFRASAPVSAPARLVAAAALLAALVPVVDTRLAAPPTVLASNFVVNSTADPGDGTCDGTCTLRDAILNANTLTGPDTITFSPVVSTPIVVASDLPFITQALTIDGSGGAITIDGASLYRLLWSSAPLTLSTLIIQRGRAPNVGFGGGGAYFGSTGTLWGVSFISNTVTNGPGGGAYVGGSAVVSGTVFMTNTTNFNGGGLYVLGNGSLTAATFMSNTANSDGGGLYVFGTAVVSDSIFIRNRAAVDYNAIGGGALFTGATALLNTTFTDNTAFLDGGGAKFWGRPASATASSQTIRPPTATAAAPTWPRAARFPTPPSPAIPASATAAACIGPPPPDRPAPSPA